jgi:hypothetical protein
MIVTEINGNKTNPPSTLNVIGRIKRLDGKKITELTLCDSSQSHVMVIAGGPEHFLVDVHVNGEYFALQNPEGKPEVYHRFVAAGQNVDCSDDTTPTLSQTTKAARYFCEHGTPDPSLKWMKT